MKTITDQQQTRSSSNTWILLDNISFIIDYFSSSVIQDYHLHHHYESTSHFSRDILALVFALEVGSEARERVVSAHFFSCTF